MVKLIFCLHRRPELSREQFQAYWRDRHAPLVASFAPVLGIRRYVQCHTLDDVSFAAMTASRGSLPGYDGVAELWFDSLEQCLAARGPDAREVREAVRVPVGDDHEGVGTVERLVVAGRVRDARTEATLRLVHGGRVVRDDRRARLEQRVDERERR